MLGDVTRAKLAKATSFMREDVDVTTYFLTIMWVLQKEKLSPTSTELSRVSNISMLLRWC